MPAYCYPGNENLIILSGDIRLCTSWLKIILMSNIRIRLTIILSLAHMHRTFTVQLLIAQAVYNRTSRGTRPEGFVLGSRLPVLCSGKT